MPSFRTRTPVLVAVAVAGATALLAQSSPGLQRPRPGEGRQPEWPAPSIVDYRPRSTLAVPEHPRPRAKFVAIDIHSHHQTPVSPEQLDRIVAEMDAVNLRVVVNLSGGSGERLRQGLAAIRGSRHRERMALFANVDFGDAVGPGFGARAAAQLEADVKAGAAGLKIYKDLGLRAKRADGSRLRVDDPELDPIWAACGRLGVPVLIHTAEPAPFFEPIDTTNERWLELALFPSRRYPAGEFPRFEELVAERDRMFARHPRTRFIAAHMAYHANDLARLGGLLDRLPNVFVDTAAVLAELGRQPRTARAFLVKYQDRVLFGKDRFQPDEFAYYWRTFETADEYFDYYREYHAFWKLYGLDLPDEVLRKLYAANALAIVPGLPRFAGVGRSEP